MLQLKFKSISTPFKQPFTTAHGLKTHQEALLIALGFNQITGFGEAPAIHYYQVSVEDMIQKLQSKSEMIERYVMNEPERFWHYCHHLFPNDPFLVCALDMAYWDLYLKYTKNDRKALWNIPDQEGPLTDYTIGLDEPEKMLAKLKEMPWPIYKIKVSEPEHLNMLQLLRQHTDAKIRIDANASWAFDEALHLLPELEKLQIELIEQPLSQAENEAMVELKKHSSIPFIADESCVNEADIEKIAKGFDGINIKLTKCGGITPALRMIEKARAMNLSVMMGCMNETEIGTTPMVHMLPLLDYADMDGPLLLDVPDPAFYHYDYGKMILNKQA